MTETTQTFALPSMQDNVRPEVWSVRVDLAAAYRLAAGIHVIEALHLVYRINNFCKAQLRRQKCTTFWLTWHLQRRNRFQT